MKPHPPPQKKKNYTLSKLEIAAIPYKFQRHFLSTFTFTQLICFSNTKQIYIKYMKYIFRLNVHVRNVKQKWLHVYNYRSNDSFIYVIATFIFLGFNINAPSRFKILQQNTFFFQIKMKLNCSTDNERNI